MNPDVTVRERHTNTRLVDYSNAVTKIVQHPLLTAEMVALVVHRAHPDRIAAAWPPWIDSQREIGTAFGSSELGQAFVTHVETAVDAVEILDQLARNGLLIAPAIFELIATEDGGLLETEDQRRAWANYVAERPRHARLLQQLGAALTKLYVAEGQRMAMIFYRLTREQVPLEAIGMHLNTHLYHLLQQTLHLFQSREFVRADRALAADDESSRAYDDVALRRGVERGFANDIQKHESEARRWLKKDTTHMFEFGNLMAPYAQPR